MGWEGEKRGTKRRKRERELTVIVSSLKNATLSNAYSLLLH